MAFRLFFWSLFSFKIGDIEGWHVNANPLIDATNSIPSRVNYFGSIAPWSKAEKFKGNEIIITKVEITREIIANGAAWKTKSNFFSKVNIAKPNINTILKNFSDKNKSPEIRFKVPNISRRTSYKMSEAKRKNNADTKVIKIPESKAAALKYFSPKILLTDWVIYVSDGLKCIPKTEQVVAKIKPINNWH